MTITLGGSSNRSNRLSSNPTSYNFYNYLNQVPGYKKQSDAVLKGQAADSTNLMFDPQRQEIQRQRQINELNHFNAMNKLKASNAGVDKTLAFNDAQRKKANAVRSIAAGGGNGSGLSAYLNQQTDAATEGQRLAIAADLATRNNAEVENYGLSNNQTLGQLSNLEKSRGETGYNLYNTMLENERQREVGWDQNALQVALGIGSGEMQAADLNQRAANEQARIDQMKYDTDMGYKIAQLPYDRMTQYDQARTYLDASETFGQSPGGGGGGGSYGANANASGPAGSPVVGSVASANNGASNQYRYLQELVRKGGANAAWAMDQITKGLY